MNENEIITSGLLESYVMGTTTAEETAMVQKLSNSHPEVLREIEAIEKGVLDISSKASPKLSTDLKNKIAAQLKFKETSTSDGKVISLKNDRTNLYKFGMAASLLLFVTSLAYNVLLNRRLDSVSQELAQLNFSNSVMAEQMTVQQASLKTLDTELQILANPTVKTIALKGMKTMENHSAMIHWNTETDEVYFNASVLPASPENRQYQLWAIVDGKPVDAGMINLSDTASVFQKMKSIKGAQAFAVTIEKMNGSTVPTMETMCLLGNV